MTYQDRFYTIGDVTVENGSAVVTGTGTGWETALIDGGVIFVGGGSYPIYSVESETSLTLAYPFTGVSGADLPYAVDRQRAAATSNIQMNDRLAQIIREISIGNIEALNSLVFTGNEILQTLADGTLAKVALAANKLLRTNANKDIIQIELIDLPISTATQTALNAKASISGAAFTGAVVGTNLGFNATTPRATSTAGQTNTGGALRSSITGTNMFSNLVIQELVGSYVNATLHVSLDTSKQAFFTFRHNGAMNVPGALSKGSGTFLIDHPKDPLNKNLRHGFVESTEYVNLYRGMVDLVDGRMTVDIDATFGMADGTFEALNADVMVSSLQNQYGPERVWIEGPADSGKFTIICEDVESTATIAWMVTGRRNDAFVRSDLDPNTDSEGRFIPEFDKEDA